MSADTTKLSAKELLKQFPDVWMLRRCEYYQEEYNDCKSILGRLCHSYVHGNKVKLDCSHWNDDYKNCLKFRNTGSPEALSKVLENENIRRSQRLHGAALNDVWEYRDKPPDDWVEPLTVWQEETESVSQKGKNHTDQKKTLLKDKLGICVIL